MKYFVPFRLNRVFTIGPYHVRDAIIIILGMMVGINLILKHTFLLCFVLIYGVLTLRVDNKTIGSNILRALRFIFKRKNYSIKDIYK